MAGGRQKYHVNRLPSQKIMGASDSESEYSSSNSTSSNGSEESLEITQEMLDQLFEEAKTEMNQKIQQKQLAEQSANAVGEDIIKVADSSSKPLPRLNPGSTLPTPYFEQDETQTPSLSNHISRKVAGIGEAGPSRPPPPKESLTRRQKKEMKKKTTGPDWFDLPAPAEADLPRLHREVEALRLRNQLDPKRFYRKEEGEGKGIKGLPKHFAIGTVVTNDKPFGGPSEENLPRSARKRTLVDELVDDSEARQYAKRKFETFQGGRAARGRGTYARKFTGRKQKW